MTSRELISSGSPFEAQIGYSRAVVDGDWVFVSGTTGYDYSTMTISDDVVQQAEQADDVGLVVVQHRQQRAGVAVAQGALAKGMGQGRERLGLGGGAGDAGVLQDGLRRGDVHAAQVEGGGP